MFKKSSLALLLAGLLEVFPLNVCSIDIITSPADERVLSIQLGKHRISDGLLAYQAQPLNEERFEGVLLPLGVVSQALRLSIKVNVETGIASGWFIREDRSFYLNVEKKELIIDGKSRPFPEEKIQVFKDDIYFSAALLEEWFPVNVAVNLVQSEILISSNESLPFEEEVERNLKRDELREHVDNRHSSFSRETPYQTVILPYKLLGMSGVDVSLQQTYQKDTQSGLSSSNTQYNFFGSGDLFFMTAKTFVSGDVNDGFDGVRLTLERKSIDKNLTPWQLSHIAVGDIFTSGNSALLDNQSGRGIVFGNNPLTNYNEFDRVDIRGDMPEGWQAELYRNDILLASLAHPDALGRYEFLDVPLIWGENELTIKLYGPQGQRKEVKKTYRVGDYATPKGEHLFAVSLIEQDKDVFDHLNNKNDGVNVDPAKGQLRAVFEYQTGFGRGAATKMVVGSIPTVNVENNQLERRTYLQTGVIFSLVNSFHEINVSSLDLEDKVWLWKTQFKGWGQKYRLSYQHFTYEDEVVSGLESITDFFVNGRLFEGNDLSDFNYHLNVRADRRFDDLYLYAIQQSISSHFNQLFLTNTLDATYDESLVDEPFLLSGRVLVNIPQFLGFYRLSLRGAGYYRIKPENEWTEFAMTSDYRFSDRWGARLQVTHYLQDDQADRYDIGLNTITKDFDLSLNSQYLESGNYSVYLSLNFSIDSQKRGRGGYFSSQRHSEFGGLLSRVFIDNNNNGQFDHGDEWVEGAKLRLTHRASSNRLQLSDSSNNEGKIYVGRLSPHQPVDVEIDLDSLSDPFVASMEKGHQIIPRPGVHVEVDFPLVRTGEIDGTIFKELSFKDAEFRESDFESSGNETPGKETGRKQLSGIEVELVDQQGNIHQTTYTAYDGFYLFTHVIPGTYKLRVNPIQLEKAGIHQTFEKIVTLGVKGDVLAGMDFNLSLPNTNHEQRVANRTIEKAVIPRSRLTSTNQPDVKETLSKTKSLLSAKQASLGTYYENLVSGLLHVDKENPVVVLSKKDDMSQEGLSSSQHEKVIRRYEDALRSMLKKHGVKSPQVASSLNNLGATWFYQGETEKSLKFFGRARDIFMASLGAEDHKTKIASQNLELVKQYSQSLL